VTNLTGGTGPGDPTLNGVPHTAQLRAALAPQQAAIAYTTALDHLHELDTCDLPLPSGDTVPVVAVAEVRDWLEGLRARSAAGERL
jgi:hypothetical protein